MDFDKLKRKANELAGQAKEKAGELQEKSKPKLAEAREKASQLGEKASDAIQKGADKAQESAKSFREGHAEDPSAPPTASAETLHAAPDPTVPGTPTDTPTGTTPRPDDRFGARLRSGSAGMSGAGPTVTVRFWAGARRAAGRAEEQVVAPDVRALRALLGERPALATVVLASSLLVDGVAPASDETVLRDGAVVDVLPPFAGG